MTSADILVLIVNYRTPALTVRSIEAIAGEICSRGDAHVLVVDNGSGDGSADAIERAIADMGAQSWCSLLALDTNDGFAAGNNAGLNHYRRMAVPGGDTAKPEFVWLLNPDTVAEPGALTGLVDFLRAGASAGLAGGQSFRPDGSPRHSAFRFHSPLGEFVTALDLGPLRRWFGRYDVTLPFSDRPFRADWLSAANLLIRTSLFDAIGPFDPRYFLYFEETDFCARAARAGFQAWHVPASRITHIGGQSTGIDSGEDPRRPHYWFASRARFFLRHHGAPATHLANLFWLIATPPGQLLARLRGRPRHDPPRLWWDFLRYNYGPRGLMYRAAEVAA